MESPDESQATVRPLVIPEIVTLPSDVDATNARRLGHEVLGAFGPRATVVIADMALTGFCDSSGIGHLLIANHAAMAWGGELRVVVSSPQVLRVMQITGADRVLQIYSSLGEALTGKPGFEAPTLQQTPESRNAIGKPEMAQAQTTPNRGKRTLPLGRKARKRGGRW